MEGNNHAHEIVTPVPDHPGLPASLDQVTGLPGEGGPPDDSCRTDDLASSAHVSHSLQIGLPERLGFIHTSWMDASVDPYARLATLLWILKPADVARLVEVADGLAEQRLVAFLGSAGSEPGQATPRPHNRS